MFADVIVIGAGAGGCFSAVNIAEKFPNKRILILEKSAKALEKVRISGGGRCNITNAETRPSELIKNYPRGGKELLGAFHRFNPSHTIQWFESRGVALKTEPDGRVFPQSNSSSSVIDCLTNLLKKNKVDILFRQNVTDIQRDNNLWRIETNSQNFTASKIIIATGSNPKIWKIIEKLGHKIIPPVPSLFTFNIKDDFIENLSGISQIVKINLFDIDGNPLKEKNKRIDQGGIIAPMLITHWGFSGPAVLKLSALGARILEANKYHSLLKINWITRENEALNFSEVTEKLLFFKNLHSKKSVGSSSPFNLSKKLWNKLLIYSKIEPQKIWSNLTKKDIFSLGEILTNQHFIMNGKSTFKEEFVTAGGIALNEINFKSFESKLFPNLYFTGEVLDIDAVTGGFNFQNAWTGGYIISENIF